MEISSVLTILRIKVEILDTNLRSHVHNYVFVCPLVDQSLAETCAWLLQCCFFLGGGGGGGDVCVRAHVRHDRC